MIRNRHTIVYLCNAISESILAQRGITTDSPAATNKVLALVKAMRMQNLNCVVLSLGRGRQNNSFKRYDARLERSNQAATLYCKFWKMPILTHIVTMMSVLSLLNCLINRYPRITVLVYNRSYHYLPALLLARLRGANVCLDLEDGYNIDGKGIFRILKNTLTRKIFEWLCPGGVMVSCSGLDRQIESRSAYVCYGISNNQEIQHNKWKSTRLQFLFSGTLLEEVGCLLLLEALSILRKDNPDLSKQLHVVVTGKGSCASEFKSFAATAPDWLTFHGAVSRKEYLDILRESHVGMSLRLSNFEMGATTFSSKVIEYAEHGLLVLTTRSSDVPTLFGETAVYLSEETPAGLAYLITGLIESREYLKDLANSGRSRVNEICSPLKVGSEIKKMLLAEQLH